MALATRCPHCKTTFRVAHDQLKLRSGLVRCGACKEIFNGVEHLLRPEETQAVLDTPATPSPATAHTPPNQDAVKEHGSADAAPQTELSAESESGSQAPHADDSSIEAQSEAPSPAATSDHHAAPDNPLPDIENLSNKEDPLQRMTLMDVTAFATPPKNETAAGAATDAEPGARSTTQRPGLDSDANDELSKAIDNLQSKPWRRKKHKGLSGSAEENDFSENPDEVAEPDFVKRARRQKHYGRALSLAMGIATFILFLVLLAQALYAFRPLIAAHVPAARPVLAFLCDIAHCRIGLPAQIERISIESSELKVSPAAPNRLTLIALLRNHANTVQAWPNIELTLTDDDLKPVARKVLTPRDYLPSSQLVAQGFPARSEQAIKVPFELAQVEASDYRLYLFYP